MLKRENRLWLAVVVVFVGVLLLVIPQKVYAAAPAFSSANTDNCKGCHQQHSESLTNGKALLSKHAAAAPDCFACHEKSSLQAKHPDVAKVPGRLMRQRKYPNELCVNCHGSYDQLIAETKNSKAFTALDGKVINPHSVEASVPGDAHAKKECFNCHKMHKEGKPIDYCYGCHHARQLNACKECHAKNE